MTINIKLKTSTEAVKVFLNSPHLPSLVGVFTEKNPLYGS